MKSPSVSRAKWSLLSLSLLLCGTHNLQAQNRWPSINKQTSSTVLGGPSQQLLKRYGKPTAICILPDSPPNKLHVPDGVPQLAATAIPRWAQSAALPLAGKARRMLWLYKRNEQVASYLIDPLGYVDAACSAASEKPTSPLNQQFEVSTLPPTALGEGIQNVLKRYGYPDRIRSIGNGLTELTFPSATKPTGYADVFATVVTIRDNQVARVYSYSYMPAPSREQPFDKSPEGSQGRFFLLNPA